MDIGDILKDLQARAEGAPDAPDATDGIDGKATASQTHEATGGVLTLEVMQETIDKLKDRDIDPGHYQVPPHMVDPMLDHLAGQVHTMMIHDLETHGEEEDDDGNRYGLFTGWASVFGNVDSTGEIIETGAFTKTIKDNGGTFPLLWSHKFFDMPLGDVDVDETKRGLKVTRGRVLLGRTIDGVFHASQRGLDIYALLKQKAIKAMSIGFRTMKEDVIDNVRHLKEIRLFEVSLVNFPANKRAVITGVKTDTDDATDLVDDLLERQDTDILAAVETLVANIDGSDLDAKATMVIEDIIEALHQMVEPPLHSPDDAAATGDEPTTKSLAALVEDMKTHTTTKE